MSGLRRLWPLAVALLVGAPLLRHGASCGQDFHFHMTSWMDAVAAWKQGVVYPVWTPSAAWNAGEPRFVFYPPLSWMLGGALSLLMRAAWVPVAFVMMVTAGATWSMERAARLFVSPRAAMVAGVVYAVNPYFLFTAYERSAFGELLAAVWMPLLLGALLAEELSVTAVAVPLALLWLTNVPAALMGCYLVLAVGALRLAMGGSRGDVVQWLTLGAVSGVAMAAVYIVPAVLQRGFVQSSLALVGGMQVDRNFLFTRANDAAFTAVNTTVSWAAVVLALLTSGMLSVVLWLRTSGRSRQTVWLCALTVMLTVMMVPMSRVLWHLLPEVQMLQFPWRLLTVLAAVMGFAAATLVDRIRMQGVAMAACFVVAVAGVWWGYMSYAQSCAVEDSPARLARLHSTGHGVPATDEYTPSSADNDALRTDLPAWWLSEDVQSQPAGTSVPPPGDSDALPPAEKTVSARAPERLVVSADRDEYLVLHLRAYPRWVVQVNGVVTAAVDREDGLLAVPLKAGRSEVTVVWSGWDRWLGLLVSLIAVVGLSWRRRGAC